MTFFPRKLRFWTALGLMSFMTLLNISPAAAGLAPSRVSGTTSITSARDADMVVMQRALENKVVAQKLQDYGVPAKDAQLKLANMSDEDLHVLASASKGLPSGGDGSTGLIIGILVIIILVIVVLKLMNKEVIVR